MWCNQTASELLLWGDSTNFPVSSTSRSTNYIHPSSLGKHAPFTQPIRKQYENRCKRCGKQRYRSTLSWVCHLRMDEIHHALNEETNKVCAVWSLKHHPASRGPDCVTETKEEERPVYSERYHIRDGTTGYDGGGNTTGNPKIPKKKKVLSNLRT